ncbi:MAG: SUMF1/EgtB/PvdO family nonheme iron enzyme [Anaerolineales bacterium]|nr:SUMF1/EgtB/PvdO family nonheme iron enzyme [Anaerolineales bacterium]
MILVPAGEFTMGSSAEDAIVECQKRSIIQNTSGWDCSKDSFIDGEPAHTVYLDAYDIDKYEVSNAAYRACVEAGECSPPDDNWTPIPNSYYGNSAYDDYPVHVDWNMAKAFCEWRGARLPTEAEWEKAARGSNGSVYPWGNAFDVTKLNFCDKQCRWANNNINYNDGFAESAPVDSYPNGVSQYGIYNMAGNVYEWVNDWYSETYYQSSPSSNPLGPNTGEFRVLRGGSWSSRSDTYFRSTFRNMNPPTSEGRDDGFRCARSP